MSAIDRLRNKRIPRSRAARIPTAGLQPTNRGARPITATEKAAIDTIVMPNMCYRNDIGEQWIDGHGDRLQAWGYLGLQT